MRYRSIDNWKDSSSMEGLVFFAQLCDELLSDHTLDTYKPSALNTATLAIESKLAFADVDAELIDPQNLIHLFSELCHSLKQDAAARSLLSLSPETVSKRLLREDVLEYEKRVVLDILLSEISPSLYKAKTEELLVAEIMKEDGSKKLIQDLSRNYITSLVWMGYSVNFLKRELIDFFFSEQSQIHSVEQISDFLSRFSGRKISYTIVFRADMLFRSLKESLDVFKIVLLESLEDGDLPDSVVNKQLFGRGPFLLMKDVPALDAFTARLLAEKRLSLIAKLTSLYHHRKPLKWKRLALVYEPSHACTELVNLPRNPMQLCADNHIDKAALTLRGFIRDFQIGEKHSFLRFERAIDMHALALRSDSAENQLLNLWIALETLVPSRASKSKAKINNVIDSVLPFLCIKYIYNLTENLSSDINARCGNEIGESLSQVPGDTIRAKIVKALLLPEYSEYKDRLYVLVNDYCLLRNRVYCFTKDLSGTKKIRNKLDSHWDRVRWQIRRIYRTRNLIVHTGFTPSYTSTLIQNAHDYLDIVTESIIQLASSENRIRTVDQAFKFTELKYEEYLNKLPKADEPITSENIEVLLLSTGKA